MRTVLFVVLSMFFLSVYSCWAAPLHLTTPAHVTARFHNDQGISLASKGENDRALAEFNKALNLSPDFVSALFNRGLVYLQMGQYDQAVADFDKVVEIGAQNVGAPVIREATHVPHELYAEVYLYRGTAHLNKADYDLSIGDFTKAIETDQKLARAFNARGAAYLEKGDFDHAMVDLQSALKLNPEYALAYMNRGLLYYRKNENDFAIRDYKEAIRLDPKLPLAYVNRGYAYVKNRRVDLALADFSTARALTPDDPSVFAGLASFYALEKKFPEAETLYKSALVNFEKRFGPMHPRVAEVLEHYSSMLRNVGREAEAAQMEERSKAIRAMHQR